MIGCFTQLSFSSWISTIACGALQERRFRCSELLFLALSLYPMDFKMTGINAHLSSER